MPHSPIIPASQSPENGSRLCKKHPPVGGGAAGFANSRNPLRTGLGSARNGGKAVIALSTQRGRNPLRTGLGSASRAMLRSTRHPEYSRNPLRTGLGSASGGRRPRAAAQTPGAGRNPLRTGLGSASVRGPRGMVALRDSSQSPENGSRLCKTTSRWAVRGCLSKSQSPENGSRLCKATHGPSRVAVIATSQSPENGSRLCKRSRCGTALKRNRRILVAIP